MLAEVVNKDERVEEGGEDEEEKESKGNRQVREGQPTVTEEGHLYLADIMIIRYWNNRRCNQ